MNAEVMMVDSLWKILSQAMLALVLFVFNATNVCWHLPNILKEVKT